jgi:hypothetical protein
LPFCNTEQLDYLLTTATTKENWELVGEVLSKGGSKPHCTRKIEIAFEKASGRLDKELQARNSKDLERCVLTPCINILPQCTEEQLDRLLVISTKKERWDLASKVLQVARHSVSKPWRRRVKKLRTQMSLVTYCHAATLKKKGRVY